MTGLLTVNNDINSTGNIFTPSLNNNIISDWLRINNHGASSGEVALYGSLCVNATMNGHSGLAVGYWDENVGEGNIKASGNITADKCLNFTNVSSSGQPLLLSHTNGNRLILYPSWNGSTLVDYALGIEGGALWYSVPDISHTYKWYGGETSMMSLTNHNLTVENNITASGSVAGAGMVINNPSGWNYLQFLKGTTQQFAIEVTPSNNYSLLAWNGVNWVVIQTSSLATTTIYNDLNVSGNIKSNKIVLNQCDTSDGI
jgi:hypothetical protein